LRKPEALSAFSRLYGVHYIYLNIKALALANGDQYIQADCGQGYWLYQQNKAGLLHLCNLFNLDIHDFLNFSYLVLMNYIKYA